MIKVNELRIGNLVFLFTKQEIFEITDISTHNNTLSSDAYCRELDEFEPIHITEEWLSKAGFKAINYLNEYFVQEKGYKHLDMIVRYGVFDGHRFIFDFANEKCVNLKYVHQLQNLYFALCGEELVFSSTEP